VLILLSAPQKERVHGFLFVANQLALNFFIRDTLSIQCRVSAVFVAIVFSPSPPASVRLYVIKVDRRLAHSKERAMREEKITADRLTAFSDAVFAVM
jgi:hypothetical protein